MIDIRRAVPADADRLSEIALAAKRHWGYPERWIELWRPQLTFRPEYLGASETWVAEDDGVAVAFCTLLENDDGAWLENLWVLPPWIGRGLGKRLFLHAAALARRRGHKTIRLETDPQAAGFYIKMGMQKTGERQSELEGRPRRLPIMKMRLE